MSHSPKLGNAPALSHPQPNERALRERRALGILALLALAAIIKIFLPVGIGILLGALTGFTLEPLYMKLQQHKLRPVWAALGCVAIAAFGLVVVLGGLASLLIMRGTVLAQEIITEAEPGGAARVKAEHLIKHLGLKAQADSLASRLRDAAADVASRLAAIAATVAGRTFGMLLMLFFLVMTIYFVLRHWRALEARAVECLPLAEKHTIELLAELRRVGRSTLLGTVVTGVAQGLLAGIGYALFGVPEPAFFGAVTVISSLLPGVGTLLVWVPIGAYLILNGHPVKGGLELVFGSLIVVGFSDYILRPRLVGQGGDMPTLLTFAALFGGVEVFGLVGLVVGPLFVALALAVLRIYAREERAERTTVAAPSLE